MSGLRVLIILVLLLGAAYWFSEGPTNKLHTVYWALLVLPWLVAMFVPSSKIRIAAGIIFGASWVLCPIVLFFALLAPAGNRSSLPDWFLLVATAATCFWGLIFALRAPGKLTTSIVFAGLLICVGAAFYEWTVIKIAPAFDRYEPPKAGLYETVYRIQDCILSYKSGHQVYPDDLILLTGERDCGSAKPWETFDVLYNSNKDKSKGFDLIVRRRSWFREVQLVTNENGVLQESRATGRALPQNSTVVPNAAQLIYELSQCVQRFRQAHGEIPFVIGEVWDRDRDGCTAARIKLQSNLSEVDGYWIGYNPKPTVSAFELTARPERYGSSGVRSYFLDAQGKMHVTMQNRAATQDDSLAPECEYKRNVRCQA